MRQVLAPICALAIAVASGGSAAPTSSLDRYAVPALRVTLPDGRRLHIRCMGKGSPTIVLTAGAGGWGWDWRAVQPLLARRYRACAWDRAGTGYSDPDTQPQDVAHTTADLEAVLSGARIPAPYIMVGHSMGGFEALNYSFRHPGQVRGIVLVDPSGPSQIARFTAASPKATAFMGAALNAQIAAMQTCVDAAARSPAHVLPDGCVAPVPDTLSPTLKRAFTTMASRAGGITNAISLLQNFPASAAQVEAARRPLAAMPLVVLTAGTAMPLPPDLSAEAPKIARAWHDMHDEMARYSTAGVHRVVAGAGHYIQLDQPAAVVAAVQEVAAATRKKPGGDRDR